MTDSPLVEAIVRAVLAQVRLEEPACACHSVSAGCCPDRLGRMLGQGAEATAPLGRAVIGGLAMATLATLIVLPSVYSLAQQSAHAVSPSLDPDDPDSRHSAERG